VGAVDQAVRIQRLTECHAVDRFTCKQAGLDEYLQRRALSNQARHLSTTYVALVGDEVAGCDESPVIYWKGFGKPPSPSSAGKVEVGGRPSCDPRADRVDVQIVRALARTRDTLTAKDVLSRRLDELEAKYASRWNLQSANRFARI